MGSKSCISRRDFIKATAVLAPTVVMAPCQAWASQAENSPIELEGSAEARALWRDAVRRAEEEGSPIYSSDDPGACEVPEDYIMPCASARTVTVSKRCTVGLISDLMMISADYGVSSANKISPFNWTKFYCSGSTVKSSSWHRTILDGGRTNAISFHVEIAALGGWPTYVGDFYAEFYYTFTGSFK